MTKAIKVFFVCALILIGIGTFFDFQVTHFFDGHFLFIARFTEIFGEVPFALCLAIPFAIFFHFQNKPNKTINILLGGLYSLLGIFFSLFIYLGIFRYLNPTDGNSHGEVSVSMFIIAILLGLITYASFLFILSKKLPSSNRKKWIKSAISMLILSFSTVLVTNIIKMIVGRPRFWTLENNINDFIPWYEINGLTTVNANMSFVSGHTANAFVLLAFAFFFVKGTKYYTNIIIASLTWGSLVGLGRLLSGQHFLTDVVFGGLLTIILYLFIEKWLNRNNKRWDSSVKIL